MVIHAPHPGSSVEYIKMSPHVRAARVHVGRADQERDRSSGSAAALQLVRLVAITLVMSLAVAGCRSGATTLPESPTSETSAAASPHTYSSHTDCSRPAD